MILTPEYIFRKIECIHPDFLARQGIRALVLDVDNTLTGDNSQVLEDSVQAWLQEMRAAGISLTIVSNNTAGRVRPFRPTHRPGLGVPGLQAAAPGADDCPPPAGGVPNPRWPWWGIRYLPTGWLPACTGSGACSCWPRTPHDKAGSVKFKRKFEPYWIQRYYHKGGKLYE